MNHTYSKTPSPHNEPIFAYAPQSTEKIQLKKELEKQSKSILEIPVVVNGQKIFNKEKIPVSAPHKKSLILANCSQANEDNIQQAIHQSVKSQKEWASMSQASRNAVFLKAADLISGPYRSVINAATMLGQSKTVYQSEIDSVCELADFLRFNVYFAEQIHAEQPKSSAGIWNHLDARGLEGFIYAVAPFNFTAISVNLAASPVIMGCSAIWKPAATAVLASYYAMQILEEAGLPPGVINFLPGDAATISKHVLHHKEFAGLHFTGSTATFDKLWKQIADNLNTYRQYPRIVGETGGKDFVFAAPSAEIHSLSTALIRGAFEYQGQKCSAASRAYIPKSIWPKLQTKLLEDMSQIKMGDVNDFKNFMGAVIDQKAFERIQSYIESAKNDPQSKILLGGKCSQEIGYFVEPTLIQCENPRAKTMCEEIFGPVLSVFVYEDSKMEECLDLVDQSAIYALTGAIFACDRREIENLSQRLRYAAGNFYINDKPTGAVVGQQPFGGARKSGTNDKAGSIYNLIRWTSHRTIKENFVPPKDFTYPHMFES